MERRRVEPGIPHRLAFECWNTSIRDLAIRGRPSGPWQEVTVHFRVRLRHQGFFTAATLVSEFDVRRQDGAPLVHR